MNPTGTVHADLETLTNKDLISATRRWQSRRGERLPDAERVASLYEDEMNRRFGGPTTVKAPLGSDEPRKAQPWWNFW